jgi:hypothetical protein
MEPVPVNAVLPATVVTVKRTDAVLLEICVFETEHRPSAPVVHDDDPDAPLLQVPATTRPGAGCPSRVTVTVTVALQR